MQTRTLSLALEVRETPEGRTLSGLAVPYGVPTRVGGYVETMARGVFAESAEDPAAVKVLAAHDHEALPIGRAISLVEREDGLHAELFVSDTAAGRDVVTLVRDGVATGLSVGFVPLEDEWNADRTAVTRLRAALVEVSVVAWPAYEGAQIAAVRHRIETPRLAVARRLNAL